MYINARLTNRRVFIVNIQPLGAAKWNLTMLGVVWKVHNDQHQITEAPRPWIGT